MITGINHLNFAVRDLEESFRFYTETLGFRAIAMWDTGAYLLAGDVWIALQEDPQTRRRPLAEYTHVAFTVPDSEFEHASARVIQSGARIWKENTSEGKSLYFEDPNGHKLEIHSSDLGSRILHERRRSPSEFKVLEWDEGEQGS
jgi:catechol 2,3-dioxygenase-like lactoylglutathione lyase family enzyme